MSRNDLKIATECEETELPQKLFWHSYVKNSRYPLRLACKLICARLSHVATMINTVQDNAKVLGVCLQDNSKPTNSHIATDDDDDYDDCICFVLFCFVPCCGWLEEDSFLLYSSCSSFLCFTEHVIDCCEHCLLWWLSSGPDNMSCWFKRNWKLNYFYLQYFCCLGLKCNIFYRKAVQ